MSRVQRWALWAGVGLALLVVLARAGLRLLGPRWQSAADRAWAESFQSMDALVARYPATPDNPVAVELVARAKGLGISMRPPAVPGTG